MQLFSAAGIREWDAYTIRQEQISSEMLMERAAEACARWIRSRFPETIPVFIFCGKGNNGGDGLAIARMLDQSGYRVTVYITESGQMGTDDFQINLSRIHHTGCELFYIQNNSQLPGIPADAIIVDALLGTGLNRPVSGFQEELINHLNAHGNPIIAIDIPSGMSIDQSSVGNTCIRARYTLSFQQTKLPFLLPENSASTGEVVVLDIRLHEGFRNQKPTKLELVEEAWIRMLYKRRDQFSNKGNFGHALLLAGSPGMMGAAVMAASACMHAGAGKLTVSTDWNERAILQTTVPEAMIIPFSPLPDITAAADGRKPYQAIGMGPGWGKAATTAQRLSDLLDVAQQPLILDADALNLLAQNPEWMTKIPPESILTPHPGEFVRLAGKAINDFERLEQTLKMAQELGVYLVLKGRYSFIATPGGKGYFNPTGNPGMATAGSGDVLTGILTGLMAQGYQPLEVCMLGVYLHGMAGDLAAEQNGQEWLTATEITRFLGKAFLRISS